MSFVLPRIKACLSAILWAIASDRLKHWKTQIDAIKLRYRTAMKREADLFNPVRFSEKMQWRKLFEDSPLFTQLSDKIAARDYIAAHGFSSILIPQLWAGKNPRAIPFDVLPGRMSSKARMVAVKRSLSHKTKPLIDIRSLLRQSHGLPIAMARTNWSRDISTSPLKSSSKRFWSARTVGRPRSSKCSFSMERPDSRNTSA